MMQAAANVTDFYYGRSPGKVHTIPIHLMFPGFIHTWLVSTLALQCVSGIGQGGIPGGGPGPAAWGSWGYQSCTETLHKFSARGLRSFTFSMSQVDCSLVFVV
jgi:hypothetical protein